jgi:glycosyltransferase involved in cell wall biosynthesis
VTSAPLRVTVIGPAHPYKGGAAHHTTELAHRLAAAGQLTAIESWRAQYPKLLYPGQLTVAEPEMPLFTPTRRRLSWRAPLGWWLAGRRLRDQDVVVLQCHSVVQYVPYLGILRGLRGPARGRSRRPAGTSPRVVLIVNNVLPHEARAFDRALARRLYRRADLLVVHGPEQVDLAREITDTPIRVAELPPHLPGSTGARAGGADADDTVHNRLLFFGLVRPYKGLDVLLRALARATVRPNLLVAGEFWGGEGPTRQLIDELGLADRVTIRPGYVAAPDIAEIFDQVDALVLPYRSATGSQNALLAFEHGRPVIATDTGSLAAPVTDGLDGIVCRPDDVDDLADAIERFYAEGEPLRLRGNVKPPDSGPAWDRYLAALTEEL